MGYTRYHHTRINMVTIPQDFQKDVAAILGAADAAGIAVAGPMGTGDPEVSSQKVAFNGSVNGATDESHESFVIDLTGRDDWGFTKTARKPYDIVVNAVLRSAKFHGVVDSYAADGDNEEEAALALLADAGCAKRSA